MSGLEFLANNNVQGHLGYGLRKENSSVNMSIYGGVTYYTGVIGVPDSIYGSIPKYYEGFGIYASALIAKKLTYDIGAGIEMFGEYNKNQSALGFRFILFFSGAYKGPKQNYNPNVRAENKK
jgi:hypothetical protein